MKMTSTIRRFAVFTLAAVGGCEPEDTTVQVVDSATEEQQFRCQILNPNDSCTSPYALFVRDEAGDPVTQFSVGSTIRINIMAKLCLNTCPKPKNLQIILSRNGLKVADLGILGPDSPAWDWDESIWNPDTEQFEGVKLSGLLWQLPTNIYNAKLPEYGSSTEGYSYSFVFGEAGAPVNQMEQAAILEVTGSNLGPGDWIQYPKGGETFKQSDWKYSEQGFTIKWHPSRGVYNAKVSICQVGRCYFTTEVSGGSEVTFSAGWMLKLKPGQYWAQVRSTDNMYLSAKSGFFEIK